uniref:Uncharacterized protein n=1 Tax=Anguilla anguilla TaxID=7936 RepID=A0A0E9QR78_ANGAN
MLRHGLSGQRQGTDRH